ncbi:hypothetical protein [Saccharopolyspora sp. CA-218241]|uniref:hypothetical protein n=1 Tax=Saccharopolyspora sp. CA-218241 TaxID=3240027 RepID=UPI003D97552F
MEPPAVGARGRFGPPLAACLLVVVVLLLPLRADPWFYFYDDAAVQILPTWRRLGEQVLAGGWPPLLDVDAWMGGNIAAEALYGVWNPLYPLVWITAALVPDLAVAGMVIRAAALVVLTLGIYALCREYGARRSMSAALGAALPFAGSLFYFDVVLWPAALLAFAWLPHLWWAARKAGRGRINPMWTFLFGGLIVTAGNPYGMLAVCLVLLGVLVETALRGRWRSVRDLVLVSLGIGALVPLVYLPLVLSSSVTWRSETSFGNTGVMAPSPFDLPALSLPHHVPDVEGLGGAPLAVPAVYFCWFALPLAAWLDWGALRGRWRSLSACAVVAGGFLLLAIGPSEMWMFRWPIRVLHYGYLGLAVILAVLLSRGLRRDRPVLRVGARSPCCWRRRGCPVHWSPTGSGATPSGCWWSWC